LIVGCQDFFLISNSTTRGFADKVLIVNLFAEQQAITTLSQIAGSKLFVVTNENKLIQVVE